MTSAEDMDVDRIGPILYARGGDGRVNHLSALVIRPEGEPFPHLRVTESELTVPGHEIAQRCGFVVRRYDFELPAGRAASYSLADEVFEVAAPDAPDCRYAYVSCNGCEEGDTERPLAERDVMWSRLVHDHERQPFALLLQGGDQLYADDVLSCHPDVEAWWSAEPADTARFSATLDVREAIRRFYFSHYRLIFARPTMRYLAARVPSIMMWDDHDIFDGWGSHATARLDSPIGRCVFEEARDAFALFQLGGAVDALPLTVLDRTGANLGQAVRYPGRSVIAPDLRSERRPDRVLGEAGWRSMERLIAETPVADRMLLMSSVPVLGPRLSWAEAVADVLPHARNYQDDLRDQWQSRYHRAEWTRFLKLVVDWRRQGKGEITFLSGEIHLATRGELDLQDGSVIHQLVASGISHPAPGPGYPLILTLLSRFGESPLKGCAMRARRLPRALKTYVGERNYLILAAEADRWTAQWELEISGRTPPLAI